MKKRIPLLLALLLLAGCAKPATPAPATEAEEIIETTAPILPTAKADGNPASIFYTDCYTRTAAAPDAAVAVFGQHTLTNRDLQPLYALAASAGAPETELPLWAVESSAFPGQSLEQEYLQKALSLWQFICILTDAASGTQPAEDPGYQPSAQQHRTYVPEGLPMADSFYSNKPGYRLPAMHRAFIENLPELLDTLAADRGFASRTGLAKALGTDEESLVRLCADINTAYSYYTNLYLGASTPVTEGSLVNLRQFLILPEGETAADGTVTATEAAWQAAQEKAEKILADWADTNEARRHPGASFGRLVRDVSADTATVLDGGSLHALAPGQLLPELDDWCFDARRAPGDTAVIPTRKGISVVFFAGRTAPEEVNVHLYTGNTLQVDYSAVSLTPPEPVLSLSDVLYPDVGHQQIDEVPTYFQQDYPNVRLNGVSLPIGGCGITSLAMMATYLSDTVITPTELAARYSIEYTSSGGTNGDIFVQITPDLNIYGGMNHSQWNEVTDFLSRGIPVVSLQLGGAFTSAGHYIVLSGLTDDGKVIVRDPNITNYAKLSGFREGAFDPSVVLRGANIFWTFDEKLLTVSACSRCGDGKCYALQSDYLCRKCLSATGRRTAFLRDATNCTQ